MITISVDTAKYPDLCDFTDPKSVLAVWIQEKYLIYTRQKATLHAEHPQLSELINSAVERIEDVSERVETSINISREAAMASQKSATEAMNATSALGVFKENSSRRGQVGEFLLSVCLLPLTDDGYLIEDTSKKSHSGDRIVRKGDFAVICDSKNPKTSNPVKIEEIEKLKRDMETKKAQFGLITSTTSFATHRDFGLETYHREGRVCFILALGRVNERPEVVPFLVRILYAVYQSCKKDSTDTTVLSERTLATVKELLIDVHGSVLELNDRIRESDEDLKKRQENHRKLHTTVDRLIARFEERIKTCELMAGMKL
jgi:hypothetical protein